ncbi:hypothetical protein RFI_27081, partial [Reticulomyxa filosa]
MTWERPRDEARPTRSNRNEGIENKNKDISGMAESTQSKRQQKKTGMKRTLQECSDDEEEKNRLFHFSSFSAWASPPQNRGYPNSKAQLGNVIVTTNKKKKKKGTNVEETKMEDIPDLTAFLLSNSDTQSPREKRRPRRSDVGLIDECSENGSGGNGSNPLGNVPLEVLEYFNGSAMDADIVKLFEQWIKVHDKGKEERKESNSSGGGGGGGGGGEDDNNKNGNTTMAPSANPTDRMWALEEQFFEWKKEYPGVLLLIENGYKYECFHVDALM